MKQSFLIILSIFIGIIIGLMVFWGLPKFLLITFSIIFLFLCGFILKDPFLGFLFVIFFLPFERIGSYDIFGITVRISQVFILITLLVWFTQKITSGNLKFHKNFLTIPLLLFTAVMLASLLAARDLSRGWQVFLFTIFVFLAFVLPVEVVKDKNKLISIVKVLLFSCFLVSLFGLFQFVGDIVGLPNNITGLLPGYSKSVFGYPRIQSVGKEPLYFANYLFIPLFLTLSMVIRRINIIKSIWLWLILIIGVPTLILTFSQGAYLGVLGGLLTLIIFNFRLIFAKKNIILFLVSTILICLSIFFLLNLSNINAIKILKQNFWGEFFNPYSKEGRLNTFAMAWEAFKNNPLIGIGIGNFGPYWAGFPVSMPEKGWNIVNNEYLEILAETGILGFLSFLSIIIVLIAKTASRIFKTKDLFLKNFLIGSLAAFIGILIQYNTFSTLYILHIWILIGLMVAAYNISLKESSKK